jgi:23S rRNA (cytosine1962-C5)-methyltransferase
MDLVLMFEEDQYALIDFGGGEKLERFGNRIVRRETPSVDDRSANKQHWSCDAAFEKHYRTNVGGWKCDAGLAEGWSIQHDGKCFLLKQSPSGQVGVFPEQAVNWDWIQRQRERIGGLNAINLFAYTGGTTMALAKCGVSVTHVDAAKPAVAWARENAEASRLGDAPIRWIVDDAVSFMKREIKRRRQYQIIIADPPSFGRGGGKDVWKIQRDMPTLMDLAAQLSTEGLRMLVLSCHTPGIDAESLKRYARDHLKVQTGTGQPLELKLKSQSGTTLHSGDCFRWHA